jgi:alkylation response protein AidB-like acyl-CoA dehydrogenase
MYDIESFLRRKETELNLAKEKIAELTADVEAARLLLKKMKQEANIPLPKKTQKEKDAERWKRAEAALLAAGREMTSDELSAHTGLSTEATKNLMYRGISTLGLACPWVQGTTSYRFRIKEAAA